MVIGTCNFNREYNNSKIEYKDCFKILEYFEQSGGEIIDTAINYGDSQKIISEYNWKGKIITKVTKESEIDQCFEELKTDKIYCIMARDSKNLDLLYALKEKQKQGFIEKVGVSIYYQNELRQDVNAFHVPPAQWVRNNIETMVLHGDVFIRSFFNYFNPKDIMQSNVYYKDFKGFERLDLGHRIEAVVGVDNLEQLKEDMELFK